MKALSLFAGAGGDTLGLEMAGVHVVAFSEYNPDAIRTHLKNFESCEHIGASVSGDITKIPDEEFEKFKGADIVFAGFPCQGFSNAGKKKVDDPRNSLFREVVRVTSIVNPRYVIGENVTGILTRYTPAGNKVVDEIADCFGQIGYTLTYKAYDMSFCVPQSRKRVIFVASKIGNISMPEFEHIRKPVRDVLENVGDGAVLYTGSKCAEDKFLKVPFVSTEGAKPMLLKNVSRDLLKFGVGVPFGGGEILNLDAPSKTITCSYSFCPKIYVPVKASEEQYLRCYTTKELARIQGFPDDFEFQGNEKSVIHQIGNAVPPPFARDFVSKLLKDGQVQ